MKTDKDGAATCPKGQERYEAFPYRRDTRVQYDYRDHDGELFSGVFWSLEEAREEKRKWLFNKYGKELYDKYDGLFRELAKR